MTIPNFTVEYSTNGSSWTMLTNVQNVNGFCGRRMLQDTFEPSTMNVTLRYPTGYASPITDLVVGTWIRVKRTGATYEYWRGRIRDVSADYGIPYVSSVGEADYLNITAEGALAELGRLQGNGQEVTSDLVYWLLSDIGTYTGVGIGTTFTEANSPTLATTNVDGSWAEYLNLIATSVGATIKDGASTPSMFTKDFNGTLPAVFSDTLNNSTNQIYDQIRFDSLASDYFTQVEVNTQDYGTIVANVGSSPYRTLRISTINSSAAQAQDLADYYLGIYSTPSFGISEISCLANAQNDMNLEFGYAWYDLPGYRTYVNFRGNSYYMTILGTSFTADATAGTARYTYYLAAADLTPYFVLDSDIYGVLDQNKLSW
jgi:hypothetical protein